MFADEWSATLTLTEKSSQELLRVLKEQDEEFIDNLFDGKCGFTLTSTDGRSVELVPKVAEQTEPNCSEIPNNCEEPQYEMGMGTLKCDNCSEYGSFKCTKCDGEMYFKRLEPKDEPQTDEHCETCRHKDECEGATYEYKNTEWWCLAYAPIDEPQTDCPWK